MKPRLSKINYLRKIILSLNKKLDGVLTICSDEAVVKFNNSLGEGTIKGVALNNGINYLDIEGIFKESFEITTRPNQLNVLIFGYCSVGTTEYRFESHPNFLLLNTFQTAILNSKESENIFLRFKKQKKTKISLILVDKEISVFRKNELNQRLFSFFSSKNIENDFLYISSYNLKIAEQIEILNSIRSTGLVRRILLEGIIFQILGMELEQHMNDKNRKIKLFKSLSLREMLQVREVSHKIQLHPENDYCITSLCKEYSISPGKLQEGFKILHGATVNNTIKKFRLDKAEELIRKSDLNISEVVYSIGFTSRSYFSKIFKNRYKCCPNHYRANQMLSLKSA